MKKEKSGNIKKKEQKIYDKVIPTFITNINKFIN